MKKLAVLLIVLFSGYSFVAQAAKPVATVIPVGDGCFVLAEVDFVHGGDRGTGIGIWTTADGRITGLNIKYGDGKNKTESWWSEMSFYYNPGNPRAYAISYLRRSGRYAQDVFVVMYQRKHSRSDTARLFAAADAFQDKLFRDYNIVKLAKREGAKMRSSCLASRAKKAKEDRANRHKTRSTVESDIKKFLK